MMRRLAIAALCLALAACGRGGHDADAGPRGEAAADEPADEIRTGGKVRVIIVFRGAIDESLFDAADAIVVDAAEQIRMATVYVEPERIPLLRSAPGVISVELDKVVEVKPEASAHWGGEAVQAPRARAGGLTGRGVAVAVIDTGVAAHDDLPQLRGRSFVDYTDSFADDNGHGTHVAGIIAAQDNGYGITGVAPGVELYALKTLSADGYGYLSDTLLAIDWCVENGIDIANLSLGMPTSSAALRSAVERAYAAGVLVVSAAGNGGTEAGTEDTVEYPAKYDAAIAVAAVDPDGFRAPFSATGPAIELSAPGVAVVSTYLDNGYAVQDGTSMAAPFVTGTLALFRELYPEHSPARLRSLLQAGAVDFGEPGKDIRYGYGLAQAPVRFPDIAGHWAHAEILDVGARGWMIGMEGGRFEPEAVLTRGQAAAVFARRLALSDAEEEPAAPFQDIAEHWAKKEITSAYRHGVFAGLSASRFGPDEPMTREQTAMLLARLMQLERTPGMANPFRDVPETHWSADAIVACYHAGIVKGLEADAFGREFPITRAQLAALLFRTAERLANSQ
ncbi:S8 family peptidase [Paenibacillus sp.]|uniref:S8 family peptidase n=1 Tax=Paenibacillus sp. TaxID=58172 RepID=UPI002D53C33E|nr:S8 family serine peptidase [Paenibacillus sp.]HZG85506.1 S8 family serine peptidase [Paenibacillus sp.]